MKHLRTFESFELYESADPKIEAQAQEAAEEFVQDLTPAQKKELAKLKTIGIPKVSKELANVVQAQVQAQKESVKYRLNESTSVKQMSKEEKAELKQTIKKRLVFIGLGVGIASALSWSIIGYLAATGVVVTVYAITSAITFFLGAVVSAVGIGSEMSWK